MLQREARIMAISSDTVQVHLLGSACSGCSDGCGGRCNLLAPADNAVITLPRAAEMRLVPGDRVTLNFSDRALRNAAYAGYGRALLAMLTGAAFGELLASALHMPADPLVLTGLLLGVLLATRRTGDARVNPVLTVPTAHSLPLSSTSLESQEPP